MAKNNRDFFKQKKIWSEVKDELLGCYLVPYFNKIMMTRRPLMYVDCFAGKGKFEDGKNGSPLNALECLNTSLQSNRALQQGAPAPEVFMRFIELNHAQELRNNLPTNNLYRCRVIEGAFEEKILPLLNAAQRQYPTLNVFLYLDPYGIKALDMSLFQALPSSFESAELLINLNSFGFLREALRVRKIALNANDEDLLSDLVEYDSSVLDSIEDLNAIAGGDYWKPIVDRYKTHEISMIEAEKLFAEGYKQQLRYAYKYVLDMPIRLRKSTNPKYRMVHATNHADGCTLMADNIFKRTEFLVIDIQHHGQMSMFESTPDSGYVDDQKIDRNMRSLIADIANQEYIRLNELQAEFFNRYGVICSTKHLSSGREGSSLKRLEKNREILVERSTDNNAKYWSESGKKTIMIRRA